MGILRHIIGKQLHYCFICNEYQDITKRRSASVQQSYMGDKLVPGSGNNFHPNDYVFLLKCSFTDVILYKL